MHILLLKGIKVIDKYVNKLMFKIAQMQEK